MSSSRKTSSNRKSSDHRKLDRLNHINNNNFQFPIKNQIYNNNNNNNNNNFENTVNKYSIKLFEKLNLNNNKNKYIKPYEFNNNINLHLNKQNIIHTKNSKEIKPILSNRSKEKEKLEINNTNPNNKINKNLSSFTSNSSNNTNNQNNQNKQNEHIFRKYSDIIRDKNNEINKLKNINKVSRNLSNAVNIMQIDSKKKDNFNEYINNSNMLKNKNTSNVKFIIDLTNHNNNINLNKNIINKTINTENNNNNNNMINNNFTSTINTCYSGENNSNNNNNNNNNILEKEKKFSIIDIPAPVNNNDNNNINNNNNDIIININDNENNKEKMINIFKNLNLTKRENAYYLLIKSPILPLRSQLILSRSSNNIKKIITTKEILKNYELHLNKKIKDYENKIDEYNLKITSFFTSSKIAEISLNFITNDNENEFSDIYHSLLYNNDDISFIYYKTYIKIIYYIIDEKIEEVKNEDGKITTNDKKLLSNLYDILNKKGYKNIKDYLYFLFISSSNKKKDNLFMKNIDIIDELITNDAPKLLDFNELPKACKFIRFSICLIKEIIDFGNLIKNTINLKIETESFIELLKSNLDKFRIQFNTLFK